MSVSKSHDTRVLGPGKEEVHKHRASGDGRRPLAAGGPRDLAGSAASAAAKPRSTYLELSGNTVDKKREGTGEKGKQEEEIGGEYEVKCVGCKCRFCSYCCKHLGIKLRERLIPVLKTFSCMMMLTLTYDPKLFPDGPESAYWYMRKRRAVSELVRALWKAGYLKSRRWFYVVEWQENENAHFHLLVESDFIPFKVLAKFWGRNRPKSAPAWEGNYEGKTVGMAPEFGTVRFSKRRFEGPEHAANYALKYMTKPRAGGYPEWVLNSKQQIRLFEPSRGRNETTSLFPPRPKPVKEETVYKPKVHRLAGPPHADTCFCERCRGIPDEVEQEPQRVVRRTIGERVRACGTKAALVYVPEVMRPDGEVVRGRPRFVELLPLGFKETVEALGRFYTGQRKFGLLPEELELVRGLRDAKQDVCAIAAGESQQTFKRIWQREGVPR